MFLNPVLNVCISQTLVARCAQFANVRCKVCKYTFRKRALQGVCSLQTFVARCIRFANVRCKLNESRKSASEGILVSQRFVARCMRTQFSGEIDCALDGSRGKTNFRCSGTPSRTRTWRAGRPLRDGTAETSGPAGPAGGGAGVRLSPLPQPRQPRATPKRKAP